MSENQLSRPQTGLAIMGGLTPQDLETLDVEKVQALMAMQERANDRAAENALSDALARFQEAMPRVHKGKKGGHGMYAGFDDVMASAKPHLAATGLSVSFDTEATEGALTAVCHVKHRDGATFSRRATVPVDTGGRMNSAQQMGSAISYAKRYALTAALNIVTTDEDDDGEAAGSQVVTREQADAMLALFDAVGSEVSAKCLAYGECESADEFPERLYEKAMSSLRKKIKEEEGDA